MRDVYECIPSQGRHALGRADSKHEELENLWREDHSSVHDSTKENR